MKRKRGDICEREFEKEEDNNQIYAFSATFLALVSLCVSIVSLLR
jgi:hypothetical protein